MGKSRLNGIRRRNIIFAVDEKNETGLTNMVGIFSRVINEEKLETPAAVGRFVKDKDKWRFCPKPDINYQLETLSIICDTLRHLETGKLKVTKNGFKSDSIQFIDEDEEEERLSI